MKARNVGTATSRRPSASKGLVKMLLDSATGTSTLSPQAVATAKPTTGAVDTEDFPLARVLMAGTTTEDDDCQYEVTLWYPSDAPGASNSPQLIPLIKAGGIYTLGTTVSPTSASGLFADTITETVGTGCVVHSPANDSIAWLDVPLENARYIEVRIKRDGGSQTMTTADVLVQFGEDIGSLLTIEADVDLGDVDLIAAGNAMTRLGTNADAASATGNQAAQLRAIAEAVAPLLVSGVGGYIQQDSTGTIALEAGGNLATILSYLADTVSGRTYSTKAVTQGSAGYFLIGGDGSQTVRARSGLFLADAGGTIQFKYSDDNGGVTNPVNLTGAIPIGANGGFPLNRDDGIGNFVIPAGKYLGFTSATSKIFGHCNISLE